MRAAGLLVAAAALAGVAWGATPLATVGRIAWAPVRYVGGRVGDLFDVVDLSVGIGPGAKADVKYGVNFLGAGRVEAVRLGLADGRLGAWSERDRSLGLFPFSLIGWPVHVAGRALDDPKLGERALELAVAHSLGTQCIDRKALAKEGAVVVHDALKMWRHTRWGDSLPLAHG